MRNESDMNRRKLISEQDYLRRRLCLFDLRTVMRLGGGNRFQQLRGLSPSLLFVFSPSDRLTVLEDAIDSNNVDDFQHSSLSTDWDRSSIAITAGGDAVASAEGRGFRSG